MFFVAMGSGQKLLTRVRSGQFFDAQVGPGQPHLNLENPNFLLFGPKKISSGWVKKYLGQGQVWPLFTAGQKYAQVGSGQGPSLGFWLRRHLINID